MENVLRGGYGDIIRAKGSISLKEGSITFDVAGGRYSILLDEENKDSKVIFIGNRIRKQKIRKVLKGYLPVSLSQFQYIKTKRDLFS